MSKLDYPIEPITYSRLTLTAVVTEDPDSEKSTSFTSMVGPPGSIYQPGWGVTNNGRLDTQAACQVMVDHIVPPGYFSELRRLPNDEFLNQYNTTLARQVAMGSQLRLRFEQETKLLKKVVAQVARWDKRIEAREKNIRNVEALLEAEVGIKGAAEAKNVELAKELESLRVQFSDLQVSNNQLSEEVFTLQAQIMGKERIKAAFEEFKKYEDDRGSSRCAKMDARLDALSIDFDEELYPHMLTAIVGRRWIIGHGLHLAVMKCAESTELRQVFTNKLKDTPIDVIMASLFLESDYGEDAPQWVRELHPNSSQLKIPLYPKVRNLKDPWSFKDEILLEDAIVTNVSRAEKKKKCRVVCRTHRVGFAHHVRFDGIPVSVHAVAPQGLAILLADAATQTEII
nr:hypothetical protein [Tanacetum cinerariifolium]